MNTISTFAILAITFSSALAHGAAPAASPREIAKLVVSTIDERYLYTDSNPSWKTVRSKILAAKESTNQSMYARVASELASLRDSELHLVSPSQAAAIGREGKGTALGLGLIDFGIDLVPETGQARVVTPLIGSPAANAGVRSGDVIVSINGQLTSRLDHEQVSDALRESSADLVLGRGSKRFHVHLDRSESPLSAVVAESATAHESEFAYIRIAEFTPDSGDLVRAQVEKFEATHPRGYILDLRNNPGGFLTSAATVARTFASGPLGSKVRRNGDVEPIISDLTPITAAPLVLLVNEGTASAAEFVAGALHDLHRAKLVGTPTYGRGQAQIFLPLADGYGLVVPSALLMTASGRRFKGAGLQPDDLVESRPVLESDLGTPRDRQFQRAVEILAKPKA
jgi:carboxyl-terminal processing protease